MPVTFYNPGTRLYEKMAFDHPVNDIKQVNMVAYFQIDAPERSFFEVPTEVEVDTGSGPESVSVKFADRIQKDYRTYGLVRVDPRMRDKGKGYRADDNVAENEKEAREKGDRFWRSYLEEKAREHILNVEQAHAMGGVPRRAQGIFAQALKTLRIEDPADKVGSAINKTEDTHRMSTMQAQIDRLAALLEQATAAKGK